MSEAALSAGPKKAEPDRPHIVVVGDVMLDLYLYGEVRAHGLPLEGGAPPVLELAEGAQVVRCLGGAGNVAAAAAALGARVSLLGLVGDDAEAAQVRALAKGLGVDVAGLVTDPERPTTVKTRVLAHQRPVLRVDREQRATAGHQVVSAVDAALAERLVQADAVVFSDYDKGLFRGAPVGGWIDAARALGVPRLVDPKPLNLSRFAGATVITPNLAEAQAAVGDGLGLPALAEALRARCACEEVVVTLGAQGYYAALRSEGQLMSPSAARRVVDDTGAGDTFIAALAFGFALGWSSRRSLAFANGAAGLVVARAGTASVTFDEALAHCHIRRRGAGG